MFHEKRTIALNFSDYSIETVELVHDKGIFSIKNQSRILLESGVLEDGKIIDQKKLRESIVKLFAEAKPAPIVAHEVAITIPESRVFVQTLHLGAHIAQKQRANALIALAAESMPIDAKSMAADFMEIRSTNEGKEYVFAATYQSFVQEYVQFFQSMQLKVSLVTMESLALAAAIVDDASPDAVLVLDIGARTTIASIIQSGTLQESININIAGNAITAALAEKLKISTADAEQRKIANGLRAANGSGDGSEMLIMQGQIQPLKDELLVLIKYFERRTGGTIARVLLAGGSAGLAGLDEYFSSNLGLPVTVATPSAQFALDTQQSYTPAFLVVLGLARLGMGRGEQTINFLSHREKEWVPESTATARGSVATPIPTAQGPKRSRRVVLLGIMLLVIANVMAWLLWTKYGPQGIPQVGDMGSSAVSEVLKNGLSIIVRPFSSKTVEQGNALSFIFTVATAPAANAAETVSAVRETLTLDDSMPFDTSTRDFVRHQVQAAMASGAEPSEEAVDAALKEYLAERLWEEHFEEQRVVQAQRGFILAPSFIEKAIVTAEPVIEGSDQSTFSKMRLVVDYTTLVMTDTERFEQIEQSAVNAFLNGRAGLIVSTKKFTYTSLGDDLLRVTALYTFKQE